MTLHPEHSVVNQIMDDTIQPETQSEILQQLRGLHIFPLNRS